MLHTETGWERDRGIVYTPGCTGRKQTSGSYRYPKGIYTALLRSCFNEKGFLKFVCKNDILLQQLMVTQGRFQDFSPGWSNFCSGCPQLQKYNPFPHSRRYKPFLSVLTKLPVFTYISFFQGGRSEPFQWVTPRWIQPCNMCLVAGRRFFICIDVKHTIISLTLHDCSYECM